LIISSLVAVAVEVAHKKLLLLVEGVQVLPFIKHLLHYPVDHTQ